MSHVKTLLELRPLQPFNSLTFQKNVGSFPSHLLLMCFYVLCYVNICANVQPVWSLPLLMGDNELSMFAVTCKRHVVSFISAEFKIQRHVYAFRCNIICNLHNDKQYTMYSISQALCNIVQHYCHKRGLASWLKCKDHCFPPCEENILLHLYSEHLVVNIGIITKV